MKSRKKSKKRSASSLSLFPACFYGMGIGMVTSVILLIVFTAICTANSNPERLMTPLAMVTNVISYFICGFCASRRCKGALPVGAVSGVMLSAFFFLVSMFIGGDFGNLFSLPISLMIRLSLIAVCIFGAVLGANKRR